jgi:hypothetical protein
LVGRTRQQCTHSQKVQSSHSMLPRRTQLRIHTRSHYQTQPTSPPILTWRRAERAALAARVYRTACVLWGKGEKTVISHLRATLSYKTIVQVLACGRTAHPSSWHTSAWATHDKVECRKICNRSQVTYRLWHCVELQEVNGWSTDPCTSTNTLWVDSVLT